MIASALLLWLTTALIVTVLVVHERAATLERAMRTSNALALALEAHTARTFQAIDVTLTGLAESMRLLPRLSPNDRAFQQAMVAHMQTLQPYVRTIYVVGRDGSVIHNTGYPQAPSIALADRTYFQRHRQNPALERAVSEPLESRSTGDWFLAVSRPVGNAEHFEGIIVAAVEPKYFAVMYRSLGLGEADNIALYHRDGVLIASYPENEAIGQSFAKTPIFSNRLPKSPAGSYVTSSGLFPHERLVSYRALHDVPLVVALAQGTDTILATWRRGATGAAIAMGGLLALLAALAFVFLRQQRLRERARERQAQAEKLEALGHLTGGIAHDFNNLLVVVSSSLPLIKHEGLDGEQREQALAVAERALARGANLVRQLSAFARRRPMHVEPTDLNRLVKDSIDMLRHAVGPGIQITAELAEALAPCRLDETELEVALVNLVVNAKDAMKDKDEDKGRIVLKTYDCAEDAQPARRGQHLVDYVCLSVQDNGSGMSSDVRRRALEPYYSTKGEAGTGLGLSQVYGFMKQIGGEVHVESQPGAGTKVHLLFPK